MGQCSNQLSHTGQGNTFTFKDRGPGSERKTSFNEVEPGMAFGSGATDPRSDVFHENPELCDVLLQASVTWKHENVKGRKMILQIVSKKCHHPAFAPLLQ